LLAAGALIGPSVTLKGLDPDDTQGDKKLVKILKTMGADIKIKKSSIIINRSKNLRGIKIDANDIPDLLPTLAVLGTQAAGATEIVNVKQARIKETDRIHSMTKGLRALGARIDEKKDGMTIYTSQLAGAKIQGYNDHRTVMALTLAGLIASGKTVVTNAEAVNKTYPSFYSTIKKLGGKILLTK